MLNEQDLQTLAQKGIAEETVKEQIKRFETGFPYLELLSAATPDDGITLLDDATREDAIERWEQYLAEGGKVTKMVPASGAASRMFKSLFAFVDGSENEPKEGSDVAEVIANIANFAFYSDLNERLAALYGLSAEQMIEQRRFKEVISAIINPEGLNYGNLPKGLLKFHHYGEGVDRTPVEEQLVEGLQTVADKEGNVNVHFTVSPDHRAKFEQTLANVVPTLEQSSGAKFHVTLSEQKASTDTLAVNPDNTPFREEGKMIFRPGGHGALIENLNDLDSTVVYIKNIDNVVPDANRAATVEYKKVLGGYLIMLHDQIEEYIDMLNSGNCDAGDLAEIMDFMLETLSITMPDDYDMTNDQLVEFLKNKLNRPLRVCGMVRNEGEPGGGPYLAYNADGTSSPQILESNQIDLSNPEYKAMMSDATHFNPVDLVCYITDIEGKKFDLRKHVDPSTGFISSKSLHGKTLKALELPGLWNGAMSDWTTVFVEVPIATFNPVKTVNDLLRPAHRN
ncbi:MAG: DUF4301 family protein [Muribaculaceae bacterium]|nr:DUF4301 family protein [Muribaculaceae bacterium]